MIFVSGLHIVIVVIFPFELLGLGERIHTLGVGNWLLDPVSKINELIKNKHCVNSDNFIQGGPSIC